MGLDAVVKVGGSLLRDLRGLKRFCRELEEASRRLKFVIVPGGGVFADVVRKVDEELKLSSKASHIMALMSMDQYGMLLADLMPNMKVKEKLGEVKEESCILLPFREVKDDDALPASWETTGDAVAARLAERLGVGLLVLVKDVDGLLNDEGRLIESIEASRLLQSSKPTCIDSVAPKIILRAGITCYLVNGLTENYLTKLLRGEKVPCTRIDPR